MLSSCKEQIYINIVSFRLRTARRGQESRQSDLWDFLHIFSYFKLLNLIPNYKSILIEKVTLELQIFLLSQDESASFVRICVRIQPWIEFQPWIESHGEPYT